MKKWFVLYTKPRQEIKVADKLNNLNFISYCPTFKVVKQYSDRKKRIKKPLLPSYVMVYISDKERAKVFSIPGIVNYVFWLGKPAVVRDKEIILMQNYLNKDYKNISTQPLKRGDVYPIRSGPFLGQTGKVLEIKPSTVKLELHSLGVLVTLDREVA